MNCQVVLKPLSPSMRNIYCFRKWEKRKAGALVIHLFHLENRAKAFQIPASQSSDSWEPEVGLVSKAVMARWYRALIWSKAPGSVQLCTENVNDDNRIYACLMSCNKIPQASATVLFCTLPSPDAVWGHCTWLHGPLSLNTEAPSHLWHKPVGFYCQHSWNNACFTRHEMAGWQAMSESYNHLQSLVQNQADLGASAWPDGAPGKKTADSAAVQWRDVPRHCRTDHDLVQCCAQALNTAHSRARDSQQAFGNARATRSISKSSRRESQPTGKGTTSRYCPKKSHCAKVSSMIEWGTRQHAKGSCQHQVTTVPPCWLGCATALFVPRSRVTLWNYNLKDLSSRQLS